METAASPASHPCTALPLHSPLPHQGAASVQQLEQRGLNAWPAPRSAVVGDWLLRSAAGHTKRANSANALQPGAALTAQLLRQIEDFYAQQQLPCIFRLSPLAGGGVDELLHAEGYRIVDPSIVMQRAAQADDAQWQPAAGLTLELDAQLGQRWLEGHCAASAHPPHLQHAHRMILQSIGMRCAYASLLQAGEVRAWGLAVFERDAAGLYEVLVHPAHRGQGLGRQMLQALLRWAARQGATHTDLQVRDGNRAAQRLYASLGFAPAYGYHYRVKS
ncbi:GNAT family N-acetyltransferase [Comamonas endophytica]|uniref:GNAT family N-acetyltransferase n=1 Tax=Comamonas endophytica TaxID=2949090 RepID=A0ABY6GGV0_9BURK|nr:MULTISPECIES: GNAT family N-acetyltransferase [unclassified Acidovorax]MCD2514443.1 GNAT family N-acetyltransferase [Acidovorax sp. D4N7]UYG53732.1 GNAT family N-acetyltransferase [Acidovorax sp. 5MLIR]